MYTSQLSTLAVAMLAMASSVQSHMIMAQPKPFGNPNNSPLDPSGSDYPCKITGGAAGEGPNNDFKVGSTQQLAFSGSAVHGGGSCQLAVTTDKNPTKDSKFKVIHSIEGGCPGTTTGSSSTFSFNVPDALPNGEAVFAWSWFNHIGNREMYMNCAYITISGGKDDTAAFDALPDLALANIAVGSGASCKTSESFDYTFQGVGQNGDTVEKAGSGPFKDLCGGEASTGGGSGSGNTGGGADTGAGTGSGSGSGAANNGQYTPQAGEGGAAPTSAPAPVASEAPVATQAPVASPPASPPVLAPGASGAVTSTVRTLITVTGAPSATAPASPVNSSAPVASAQPTQAPAAPAPSGGASAGTCSADGQIVCNGETQFGLCNHGSVVWQAVAPGTKCSNGQVQKREYTHRIQRAAI